VSMRSAVGTTKVPRMTSDKRAAQEAAEKAARVAPEKTPKRTDKRAAQEAAEKAARVAPEKTAKRTVRPWSDVP
jgi:hypothetical protein